MKKVFPLKNSPIVKNDIYQDPPIYTTREPETEEEYANKFKKKPKISSNVTFKAEHLDDYYVVGAEVFKNFYKDQAKEGKSFNPYEYNIYNDIYSNLEPSEFRDMNEEYLPVKKDHNITFKNMEEPSEYNLSGNYVDVIDHEINRPIFVPSKKEKREYFNQRIIFKTEFKENSRDIHNNKILETLGMVSSDFSKPFNLFNPELDKIIERLKEIKESNRNKFVYPDNIDFAYSNEKFSRSVEEGSLIEVADFFEPESILEIKEIMTKLDREISNMNHSLFANLLMRFFFDINLNIKPIWVKMEQIILNNLHHLPVKDICKIYYIATISSPRFSTSHFRNELKKEILKNNINNYSHLDLVNILIGFKYSRDREFFEKITTAAAKNIEPWMNQSISNAIKADKHPQKKSQINLSETPEQLITSVFYALCYGKPSQMKPLDVIDTKENFHDQVNEFLDNIVNCISTMNSTQILAILEALCLSETFEFADIIVAKIERYFTSPGFVKEKGSGNKLANLSVSQISDLAMYLNRMKKGNMSGSEEFVIKILQRILDNSNNNMLLKKMTIEEASEVMYLFASRRLDFNSDGKPTDERKSIYNSFKKQLDDHLNSIASSITNYKPLSLILYYLMFTRNEDIQLINKLLTSCDNIKGKLSVKYYRAFKYFDHYLRNIGTLKNTYNYENLKSFRDRFFFAESVYNIYKNEKHFKSEIRNANVYRTLKGRLGYFPICCIPYQNLFLIPFSLETRKISIFILYENDCLPKTKKLHPLTLLSLDLNRCRENWFTIAYTWDEYMGLGNVEEREKKLHDLIEEITDKQVEKGLFKRNPKYL